MPPTLPPARPKFPASLVAALLFSALPLPSPAATLVRDGQATAVIALPLEPDASEALAAKVLIEHVEKISGAKLEIATVNAPNVDAFLAKDSRPKSARRFSSGAM